MSTLPRSRSLGRADSAGLSLQRDKNRPSSLCEASWVRITPASDDLRQEVLRRTPSQANNLCTTVPTSLVSRNLGGRHAPTRHSLRHSRMIVANKDTSSRVQVPPAKRRWKSGGRDLGRLGALVVTAQILVGLMGIVLSVWFLLWTPFLHFREIPHYAAIPVFLSGIFGAIFLQYSNRSKKCLSYFLKFVVGFLCCISTVTCMCLCVFSAFHLIQLIPMECTQSTSTIAVHSVDPPPPGFLKKSPDSEILPFQDVPLKASEKIQIVEDEDEVEGSGEGPHLYQDDEDLHSTTPLLNPPTTKPPSPAPKGPSMGQSNIVINCRCERRREGWRIVFAYPGLSCGEVKNILPILFVANCIVSAVGAILSGVILYILWVTRRTFPRAVGSNPSELRPFIYKSNFKNPPKNQNGNLANGSFYR